MFFVHVDVYIDYKTLLVVITEKVEQLVTRYMKCSKKHCSYVPSYIVLPHQLKV